MSGVKMANNSAKMPFGANNDRPCGASLIATSLSPAELHFAVATGNRQTRRLALRNLKKQQSEQANRDQPAALGEDRGKAHA